MTKSTKTIAIFSIIFTILVFACITTASAGTYSITQSSKYLISTDGTILKDALPIHIDLSDWSDRDLKELKNKMNAANWKLKAHYDSDHTTMKVFQEEIDKSDIHFHAGHGLNIPFIVGGHMELRDYPLPGNSVTPNDVKGKWNHCKWFLIHSCHVLEDENWANVLKGGNTHGILGFDSTAYATGHFLAEVAEKITNGWTLAKAWEQTSYEQMNIGDDEIISRSFFKNIDQYKNDKLNEPSPAMYEDIVRCDKKMGGIFKDFEQPTECISLKTGKKTTFYPETTSIKPKQDL